MGCPAVSLSSGTSASLVCRMLQCYDDRKPGADKIHVLTLDINRRYKHFQRYREITGVLLKYGLAYFLRQAGLGDEATEHRDASDESGREVHGSSAALRLRLALEELGPTFVKLGQILSTRPDLLPQEYIREFDKLQDSVHPFDPDLVKGIVEQELGRPFH
ncbi:MAG: hypothetical protein PHT33_13610, partial [bacterium]|nr:hypothetical protein [bacterium]